MKMVAAAEAREKFLKARVGSYPGCCICHFMDGHFVVWSTLLVGSVNYQAFQYMCFSTIWNAKQNYKPLQNEFDSYIYVFYQYFQLNAKLRTNYDKMKLVILLIAFHLTGQCSCLKKSWYQRKFYWWPVIKLLPLFNSRETKAKLILTFKKHFPTLRASQKFSNRRWLH